MNSQIHILFWKGGRHENLMIHANTFLLYGLQVRQQLLYSHLKADAPPKNMDNCVMRRNVSHATVSVKQIHR
ncbi:hypothetical protein G2W53_024194 [Senna tora]|uniref:Uncharacterized protein n=1 Tax=Senna tora TaxID=362788 RepID=A0A834TBZ7_9FABA|nr:hypothetical protein G2W53_024194 [Senna tora]